MSSEFLDSELSRFIASGRLNAKIDKVWRGANGGWWLWWCGVAVVEEVKSKRELGAGFVMSNFQSRSVLAHVFLPSGRW